MCSSSGGGVWIISGPGSTDPCHHHPQTHTFLNKTETIGIIAKYTLKI